MDNENNTVILYTSQSTIVADELETKGICFSRKKYVENKYEESGPIFVAAYDWFTAEAEKYLSKPDGAEYPYWAFTESYNIEQSGDSKMLRMLVPLNEAIFFDMYDWNKILSLQYIGETDSDEKNFRQLLIDYGIHRHSDIVLTNFYPDLKNQVLNSWHRLFRHHEKIKSGSSTGVKSIQAGLWCLKKDWLTG